MKTTMKARTFMGCAAILAAFGVTACGAETGSESEIGSSEQAITASDAVASTALTISAVAKYHYFGGQCVITDPTGGAGSTPKSYLLVAGGKDAAGTYSPDVHLWDGSAWVLGGSNALVQYQHAFVMQDPANAARCIVLGGEDGSKTDKIVSLTISHNQALVPSIAIAQAGKLTQARSKLQAVACDGNILAIGGDSGSASDVLDVWNTSFLAGSSTIPTFKNTAGSPATVTLAHARKDLAAAVAANVAMSKDGIVIGGGNDGAVMEEIEAIRTNGSCALDDSSATTAYDLTANLASNAGRLGGTSAAKPRSQLAAFFDGSAFRFLAGFNGTAATRDQDVVSINWTTLSSSSGTTYTANAVPVATASPLLVSLASNDVLLIGGADSDRASGNAINAVQESNAGTWTSITTYSGGGALPARLGAFGVKLGSSAYVGGGISGTDASPTFLNSMDKLF